MARSFFATRLTSATLFFLVAAGWSVQVALGTTYTFQNPDNESSLDWNTSANWTPSGIPNTSNDAAIFNRPMLTTSPSHFSVLVDEDTTVGSITVNSAGQTTNGAFTIDGFGTLIFQNSSGTATFLATDVGATPSGAGNQSQSIYIRNPNISLLSDLVITHDIRPSVANYTAEITSLVTGASNLTITSNGQTGIAFSHQGGVGFAGKYVISNNGGIRFNGNSNLAYSTGITVESGQLQLNAQANSTNSSHEWSLADGAVLELNGTGRSPGTQGALRFQGVAGDPAIHSKFNSPVVLQSNATIGLGPESVTAELTNVVSGDGGLLKNGPGTLVLSNAGNSYAGNTTFQNNSGTLRLLHPTLDDNADVLFSSNNSFLNLDYTGTDTIRSLFIAGTQQESGLWGAIGNLAADFTTDRITGTGLLNVAIGPGLDGDYNDDGIVDAADYVMWRKNPNAHGGTPGGYNVWVTNFGTTSGGGSSTAIPEPGTALLTVFALFATLTATRKR